MADFGGDGSEGLGVHGSEGGFVQEMGFELSNQVSLLAFGLVATRHRNHYSHPPHSQPAKELPDFGHNDCTDSDTLPQELGFAFTPHIAQHDRVTLLSRDDDDKRRLSMSSSSHDHVSHMENVQKSSRAISAAQLRWRNAPKTVLVILKKVS